jgi:MFS family permease
MSPPSSHERRWLILALIATAQLMIVLDLTIVNIALPSAQRDLGFSNDDRQWIITSYALAFGSLLLLGGKLGDLFGRKWAFIGGLFGFYVNLLIAVPTAIAALRLLTASAVVGTAPACDSRSIPVRCAVCDRPPTASVTDSTS